MTQQVLSILAIQELWFTSLKTIHCIEVRILWWACGRGLKGEAAGQDKPITPSSPQPCTWQQRQHTSRHNCMFWSSATHLFVAFIYFQLSYGTDFPYRNACSFIQRRKRTMSVTPYKRGDGLLLEQDMPHLFLQPEPHHTNEDISLLSSSPQEVEDPNTTRMGKVAQWYGWDALLSCCKD